MDRELQIEVAGEPVALNAFAQKIVLNTLLGLVGSLHGVDLDQEIKILVKPRAR
jgi:hypothetical protein